MQRLQPIANMGVSFPGWTKQEQEHSMNRKGRFHVWYAGHYIDFGGGISSVSDDSCTRSDA